MLLVFSRIALILSVHRKESEPISLKITSWSVTSTTFSSLFILPKYPIPLNEKISPIRYPSFEKSLSHITVLN